MICQMFTKLDLKENDWVVLRNGSISRVLKFCDELVLVSKDDCCNTDYLDKNLRVCINHDRSDSKYDVVKVVRPQLTYNLCQCSGKVVFDREKGIGCYPKFSEEERNHLKSLLTFGLNFVARDKSGEICAFYKKPYKNATEYWGVIDGRCLRLPEVLFSQIKWEDDEPFDIKAYLESGE